MKSPLLPALLWILVIAGSSNISIPSYAEAHCPANLPGLHTRLVAGALIVVPVKINEAGPFDFIVDTGSELNVIDPSLAAQLGVHQRAKVGLVTVASEFQVSVVVLDSIATGSRAVAKPLAAVEDLGAIQAADPRIRGVLGENFLVHFDLLIDYPHRLLCLDETKLMESELRGDRISLVASRRAGNSLPLSERLVVQVRLSDVGARPVLLQVDSGSDGPILYAGKKELEEPLLKRAKLQGPAVDDARRAFAVLPPQDMWLGSRVVRKVPFVTPVSNAVDAAGREEDGILATVLFQRVLVSHSGQFVIFDPR